MKKLIEVYGDYREHRALYRIKPELARSGYLRSLRDLMFDFSESELKKLDLSWEEIKEEHLHVASSNCWI